MKRAREDVEDATSVAKSAAFEDDVLWDDAQRVESESDNDSTEDSEMEVDEDAEMDAEYVKKNFDRLYVQKVVRWVEDGRNVFVTGSQGRGKSTCIKKVIQDLYRKGYKLLVTGSTGTSVVNISDVAQSELDQAIGNDLLPLEMASILAPATVHSAFGMRYVENQFLQDSRNAAAENASEAGIKEKDKPRNESEVVAAFEKMYWKRHNGARNFFIKKGKSTGCTGIPSIAYADAVIIDEISMIDDILMEALDRVGRFWRPSQKTLPFGGLKMVFVGDFQQLPPVGSGTRQNPI